MSAVAIDPDPLPPAEAARVMERILPDWFHLRPPPPSGVELVIVGRDGIETLWRMTEGLAGAVAGQLRRWGAQARIAAARTYDDRPRAQR